MRLGKELATGFVRDDAQAPGEGVASLPREVMDAKAGPPAAAPEPEPAAAEPEPAAAEPEPAATG